MKKCYLALENGDVFEGIRFGAEKDSLGELVFTTGMGGYIETLTDPGYYGQIIMQTFPLIGNYGMISEDAEGNACVARGYVAREWCDAPSNFRCEGDIDQYLRAQGVPGICGVDTRQITRIIREKGVMNAAITDEVTENTLRELSSYAVRDAVRSVGAKERTAYPAQGVEIFRVVLMDYGAKRNIIRAFNARGCTVFQLPYDATAEEVLSLEPHAVILSDGPGNPGENMHCIAQIKKLLGKLPILGLGLGHQLLGLACGAKTFKLPYGHRGANQSVKRVSDGNMYITNQNHGYAVLSGSLPASAHISYINANDGTCEGIEYPDLCAFSVQFIPEASSNSRDTTSLFDEFLKLLR